MIFKRRVREGRKISFSIFTATYNRGQTFLPQCIESVQQQIGDLFTLEHIIVNNASSDGTAGYLKAAKAKYKNLRVINSRHNLGTAGAFNRALKSATGEFLLTMGDDDMLLPLSLQMHARFILQHPELDWASGYVVVVDEDNRPVPSEINRKFNGDNFSESPPKLLQRLLRGNPIMCPATVVRRQAVIDVGGWDEAVKSEDWDMWIKLAHAGKKYMKQRAYLSYYRYHHHQLTTIHSADGTYLNDRQYFLHRYGQGSS